MNIVSTSFKSLAIFALLSGVSAVAMEKNTVVVPAPAVVKVEPVVVAPVVVQPVKKDCAVTCAISKNWNKFSASVAAKKADFVARVKDMKARGWSKWTTNEKAAVVVGGAIVVAAASYAVYKLYQSLTATQIKVKSGVRIVRVD